MREELERGTKPAKLTDEQRRFRQISRTRINHALLSKRRIALGITNLRKAKCKLNEEERQVRQKLEQRIQEEEEKMREEQTRPHNLTEEQLVIRKIIQGRRARRRVYENKRKRIAQRQSGEENQERDIEHPIDEAHSQPTGDSESQEPAEIIFVPDEH